MKLIILMIGVGLSVNNCECWHIGSNKYWLPNLEWSTNNNWINNNTPKSMGRILFPLDMYHSVGLNINNLTLSGIELPYDGSLVLTRNGILTMNNYNNNDGNNIFKWKLKGPLYWMDPENWSTLSKATPHFDRIPCASDIVILPDNNYTLSIKLPNNNVEVMEIKRGNDEILDEWNWKSLINGREFRNSRYSVGYGGLQYCGTNCLCKPNNVDELVEEICNIQSNRCKNHYCEYPLKIEGHCCDYCGGIIYVAVESASISMLTQLTNETLKNYHEDISWYVRASWYGNNNQILFAENDIYSGIKSQEAMDKLTEILIGKGIVIIDSVNTGAPLNGSPFAIIFGPMFGIPIVILLLIIVSLPYFGYSYSSILLSCREAFGTVHDGISPDITSQSNKSFAFARFENATEGGVQLASAIINDNDINHQGDDNDNDDDDKNISGTSKHFENPLYESKSNISSVSNINEEKIIDIDTPISLSALNESTIYKSDDIDKY